MFPQCVAGLPDMGEYSVVLEDFPYPVGVARHPDTHQAVGWEPRHLIPSLVGFLQEIYKQLIDICEIPMKICISWHVFYTAPPLPIISHIYQK